MKKILRSLIDENGYLQFATILSVYFLLNFVTNQFIITENFMYNSFYGQVPDQYIDDYIIMQQKWAWLIYVVNPLILILKWIFITGFILLGSVFMGYNLSFKMSFKAVMSCEWLFIVAGILNVLILLYADVRSISDFEKYNLISKISIGYLLADVFHADWIIKPLYTLNFFQILYFLLLAMVIGILSDKKYAYNLSLVIRTYGSALFIWIVLITYISVSYGQ